MADNPLNSLTEYSRFVAEMIHRPTVERSTVRVWSDSPNTGVAEGEVFFSNNIRLHLREELDFYAGLITSYGYEVYQRSERLYWYDDFPHPNDPNLASTFPRYKHMPPDIKHNRIPAPGISFSRPNVLVLVWEIEDISKP